MLPRAEATRPSERLRRSSMAASASASARAVGTAGLRQVGAAAAALAAERLGAHAHQIDGAERASVRSCGDADHEAGLAFLAHADNRDDARPDLLLALVGEAAQILEVDALRRHAQ